MNDKLVEYSFYLTYAFLVTTGTITFIESLRTENKSMRHILNLETCISIIATFFYSHFVGEFKTHGPIDYKSININRYVDWAITTPIMLLVLILAFRYNSTGTASVSLYDYFIIGVLNYSMLLIGYLGELDVLNKLFANIFSFFFFGIMFAFIYNRYLLNNNNSQNNLLFYVFLILWSLYGVIYLMKNEFRNVGYNVLDLFAKCFVGLYFWATFTKIFI